MEKLDKKTRVGFTLNELLIVVAIIAIVSAVVLVSLGYARKNSKNSRIQTAVGNIRATLETNFSPSAGYIDLKTCNGGPACGRNTSGPGDENITALEEDIQKLQGSASALVTYFTTPYVDGIGATGYSVYAYFFNGGTTSSTNNGGYICYDSQGNNIVNTTANIAIPEFPASNDACE